MYYSSMSVFPMKYISFFKRIYKKNFPINFFYNYSIYRRRKLCCDGFEPKNGGERNCGYETYFMLSDETGAGTREEEHEALRKMRGS